MKVGLCGGEDGVGGDVSVDGLRGVPVQRPILRLELQLEGSNAIQSGRDRTQRSTSIGNKIASAKGGLEFNFSTSLPTLFTMVACKVMAQIWNPGACG